MLRRSLSLAFGLLAIFHAGVLASQAWHGALGDPGLVLRWAVGAGLAFALARRWQRCQPVFSGRVPVAIWLLAALLHGPAVLDGHLELSGRATPDTVAVAIRVAAGATATFLTLGLALACLALAWRLRRSAGSLLRLLSAPRRLRRALVAHVLIAPRPPPARVTSLSFA